MSETAKTSMLAIIAMVLGVFSFFGGSIITGIPAIICGHIAVTKIKASEGGLKGKAMAIVGLVSGYLSIVFAVVFVIIIGFFADDTQTEMGQENPRMETMEQPVAPVSE